MTKSEHTQLTETLERHSKKATPGVWETEWEKNEGDYGSGPDCRTGYESKYIIGGPDKKPVRVCDTLNSENALIQEEEDGAFDIQSSADMEFIVALVNAYRSGQLVAVNTLPVVVEALQNLLNDLKERAEIGRHHPDKSISQYFTGADGETVINAGNGVLFNAYEALALCAKTGGGE